MGFKDVIEKKPRKAYMLCNEAIVRSALEANVKVVSFYPGAPQTEILDTFEKAVGHFDFRMEIAANEKVALETVAGASMVGQRSLTSMKSVGTNVASDALYSLAYTGIDGGCVCLIADDPFCHSSQSEQDGRWFGYTSYLPMLEPSNPQEAVEMVKFAFEFSEKYKTIVLIRTTTRVNHQSGIVQLNDFKRTPFKKISWKENPNKFMTVGEAARQAKLKLVKKINDIKEDLTNSPLNQILYFDRKNIRKKVGSEKEYAIGIITAGDSYNYSLESVQKLGAKVKILKIGIINPLPEKLIFSFIKSLKKVVIVEELFPYLETFVTVIAKDANPNIEIIGKKTEYFSEALEYNIPILIKALAFATGKKLAFDYDGHAKKVMKFADFLPLRLPVFCAGCPHRATFWSLRRAVKDKKNVFFANDIGCYSMMCLEPVNWTDSLLCMGASIGIAAGAQYSTDDKVIAAMGDSTFFHAGLPGIANAIHNEDNITLIILDNSITAMTGQQTHIGHEKKAGGVKGKKVVIADTLKGLGVEKIVHINSYDLIKNIKLIKEAIDYEGVSVVISHQECALYHFRNFRHSGGKITPFFIEKDKCKKAYNCIRNFMCPAISIDENDKKAVISPEICVGCGVCAKLCGYKAIKSTATLKGGEDRPYIELEDYEKLKNQIAKNPIKEEYS